jgi:hypothetical protein
VGEDIIIWALAAEAPSMAARMLDLVNIMVNVNGLFGFKSGSTKIYSCKWIRFVPDEWNQEQSKGLDLGGLVEKNEELQDVSA